jgi:hypothetical protein
MSVHPHTDGSLTGLAKRWLKTQLQFHGNPQRAYREHQEAQALEHEMREQAGDQVGRALFNGMLPGEWKRKLDHLEAQRVEQEARRKAQRQIDHLALPRASVTLTFRGAIRGVVATEMPARVEWPGAEGVFTTIELEPLEPIDVEDHAFLGLRIALPARDGRSGNPVNLARVSQQYARHWDPLDAQVRFDQSDEPYFWSDEYGAGHLWPAPGLDMVQFLLPVQNASGERVSIEGSISFGQPSAN